MNSRREMAAEALASAVCAILIGALVAGYLLVRLAGGLSGGETGPVSICERCGREVGAGDAGRDCTEEGAGHGAR